LSRDFEVALTRQPYAYVNDNPLNRTDPSGLWDWSALGDAASLVGLGASAVEVGAIALTFVEPEFAPVTIPVAAAAELVSTAALGVATFADTAAVIQHGLNSDTGSALAFDALGWIDFTHTSVVTRFIGNESRIGRV